MFIPTIADHYTFDDVNFISSAVAGQQKKGLLSIKVHATHQKMALVVAHTRICTEREGGGGGEREREERERGWEGGRGERETDRQTDRQRQRQIDRERQRDREAQRERQTDRQTDRER